MADPSRPTENPPVRVTGDRRAWSAPQLLAYGHIGKLTQGGSGAFTETGGMKASMCL